MLRVRQSPPDDVHVSNISFTQQLHEKGGQEKMKLYSSGKRESGKDTHPTIGGLFLVYDITKVSRVLAVVGNGENIVGGYYEGDHYRVADMELVHHADGTHTVKIRFHDGRKFNSRDHREYFEVRTYMGFTCGPPSHEYFVFVVCICTCKAIFISRKHQ